jgi:hypothetical protein
MVSISGYPYLGYDNECRLRHEHARKNNYEYSIIVVDFRWPSEFFRYTPKFCQAEMYLPDNFSGSFNT